MSTSLLTRKEVAAQLHTGEWTVNQLTDGGSLRAVRVGKNRRRWRQEDIDAYISENVTRSRAVPDQDDVIVISAYREAVCKTLT